MLAQEFFSACEFRRVVKQCQPHVSICPGSVSLLQESQDTPLGISKHGRCIDFALSFTKYFLSLKSCERPEI